MKKDKFKKKIPVIALLFFYIVYFATVHFYIYPETNLSIIKVVQKNQYLDKIPTEVDYLILGDSSGLYNINPKIFSENSFSAANIANTLYMTEKFASKLKKIRINRGIIITQTFIYDHYNLDLWKIHIPADAMDLKEIYTQLCSHESDACDFKYKAMLGFNYVLTKLHLDNHSIQEFARYFNELDFNKYKNYSKWFSKSINNHNGHFSQSSKIRLNENDFYRPYEENFKKGISHIPAAEYTSLKNLVLFANTKKVPIYFVLTPFDSIGKKINYQKYENDLLNVVSPFSEKMIYINGNNIKANLSHSDFIDFNHLNGDGANKFSLQLATTLNAYE